MPNDELLRVVDQLKHEEMDDENIRVVRSTQAWTAFRDRLAMEMNMKIKDKGKSQDLAPVSNLNSKSKAKATCASRGYLTWNKEMNDVLAKVFYEQQNAENKADGDWKSQVYQAVVDKLNATWQLGATKTNVKNRLKAWKRHYATITDIWNAYVQSHPNAKGYQNKAIDNWDDIIMLCGRDRATGEGVEDAGDAEEAMKFEDEEDESDVTPAASTYDSTTQPPNKKKKKDPLTKAIGDVASTLKEFMATQVTPQLKGEEVHEVVSKVPNLTKFHVFKAVRILMSGNPEEFSLLKSFSDAEKNE